MITGVVDHTRPKRDKDGRTQPFARLLDVQVGRCGAVAEEWLASKGPEFTSKIRIAAIDPYRGYTGAISATLKEADMVVDIFHVTKLASQALDEVRARSPARHPGAQGTRQRPPVSGPETPPHRRQPPHGEDGDQAGCPPPRRRPELGGDLSTWTIYQKLIDAYQQSDSHDMVTLIDALKDLGAPPAWSEARGGADS